MFSGGALERMSILALGIMPYISASIIMQLMTAVSPQLEQLKKEGESGRRKISQYTRYGTLLLASVQAFWNVGRPVIPRVVFRSWTCHYYGCLGLFDNRVDVYDVAWRANN